LKLILLPIAALLPASSCAKSSIGIIFASMLLLLPSCGRTEVSAKTELQPNKAPENSTQAASTSEIPSQITSNIAEEQSARLAELWEGLLSQNDDLRQVAIEMLRDNSDLASYPFLAKLEWKDNNLLGIVVAGKNLKTDMLSFKPLLVQIIPAIAARKPPFADWKPEECSRALLTLQGCASNMRRFVISVNSVYPSPNATLMPKELCLHELQYEICAKSNLIRNSILRSAEKNQLPGFDKETLSKLHGALDEDRKKDDALANKLKQENQRWGAQNNLDPLAQ